MAEHFRSAVSVDEAILVSDDAPRYAHEEIREACLAPW